MWVTGTELGTCAKAACPLNRSQSPLQSHLSVLSPGVYCSKSQSSLTGREQTYYRFYPGDSKTCVISPQYTHVTPGVRAQGAFRIRFSGPKTCTTHVLFPYRQNSCYCRQYCLELTGSRTWREDSAVKNTCCFKRT